MKLIDLNEWGRIVKGVNTTPDVILTKLKYKLQSLVILLTKTVSRLHLVKK